MSLFGGSSLVRALAAVGGSGVLAGGLLLAAAGPASAQAFSCGSAVTTSVKLTANVNCQSDTSDNGLNIEAPGITVNLNGHKILGPGDSAGTAGVADSAYSDVTIENGTISNFERDVSAEGSSGADLTGIVVSHLTTTDTTEEESYAVYGDYLDGAYIHNLSASDPEYGVELDNSQGCLVTGNKMTRAYTGFVDFQGMGNDWSHNTLADTVQEGVEAESARGAVIEYNTITGRSAIGVSLFASSGVLVTHNTLNVGEGVGDGLATDDTISDNTGSGDVFGIGTGDTTDDTLSGNNFSGGQYGIETDCPVGETLTGNTTDGNSQNGVFVYTASSECDPSVTYSATLSHNTANKNAFGLYSQIPTSGHANHASGNKVVNCHNVHCVNAGTEHSAAAPVHRGFALHPIAPARP